MKHFRITITLLFLSTFVGAQFNKKNYYQKLLDNPQKKAEVVTYREIFAGAEEILIFEGLPHPNREEILFTEELKRKDTIKFPQIDESFYTPAVSANNADAIIELLSKPGGIDVYTPKKCGFHSDYCIQFKSKTVKYQAFVCFSCSELIVFSEKKGEKFRFNTEHLKKLLSIYDKKRPEPMDKD